MKQVEKSKDALEEIQAEIDDIISLLDEMAFMMRTSLSRLKSKRQSINEISENRN